MVLTELIERYGNLKSEMDSYKKQVDEDNKSIKSIITKEGTPFKADNGTTSYKATGGGYEAVYSVSVSEGFDEDKLLNKIEHMTYTSENGCKVAVGSGLGIIKMKPCVDMEALENAIYNGLINPADLADCRTRKETPKLTIKKEKKKNDNE